MAPLLDSMTASIGSGFRVSVGGRSMFTSTAYIQLQSFDMPLSSRTIPMQFDECDGAMEIISIESNPEGLVRMAELAAKGEIASGVVHDVNNLLCILVANVEFLAMKTRQNDTGMGTIVAEMQLALDSINSAMNRMRGVVLSRKELMYVNIRDVTESALCLIKKQLQSEWSAKGKEIVVVNSVPESLNANMVQGDVQLAVVNILLNAAEHGIEKKGEIEIRAFKDESYTYIEIENDGRPVPDELREKLLHGPVTTHCNNGYGLYASARNIRAFGGEMTFDSDAESTIFTIRLPSYGTCE